MATLIREASGLKRIEWRVGGGVRKSLRLGRVSVKQGEAIKLRIEQLLTAKITGIMDDEAANWIGGLEDRMHLKLSRLGLVKSRENLVVTLGQLLDLFFSKLLVKPSTIAGYQQVRTVLEESFGAARTLVSITALDADNWRQAMCDRGLAEATISKRVKTARQMFRRAVRWKMLAENPFDDVRAGSQTNRLRMYFLTAEDSQRVLVACPDAEWRTIFALSRYGGLRCPSEHVALRWADVEWVKGTLLVRSAKTDAYDQHASRVIPLFPELRVHLEEARRSAPTDAEYVLARHRSERGNLRTHLRRIIRRAGLQPWPRLFNNLRASRQTELCERFPIHVVCEWLGNSRMVAMKHYLQTTDAHFAKAIAECGENLVARPLPGVSPAAPAPVTPTPTAAEIPPGDQLKSGGPGGSSALRHTSLEAAGTLWG